MARGQVKAALLRPSRRRSRAPLEADPPAALRLIMLANGLTQREVADLASVSTKTVESWLASPGSASQRAMPRRHLNLVQAMLPGYLAARGLKES